MESQLDEDTKNDQFVSTTPSRDLYTEVEDIWENPLEIIQKNPFDFDVCAELIETYTAIRNEERIHHFREHAACYCPTSEEFWLDWIHSEKKNLMNAKTVDEELSIEKNLIHLFKRGVTLVPTAELWIAYLKFLRYRRNTSWADVSSGRQITPGNICHSSITTTTVRRACEYALKELGLHATDGPQIWAFYRHFEIQLLNQLLGRDDEQQESETVSSFGTPENQLEPVNVVASPRSPNDHFQLDILPSSKSPETTKSSSLIGRQTVTQSVLMKASQDTRSTPQQKLAQSEKVKIIQQVLRIRGLFRRQMALPLVGLPDLLDEYRAVEIYVTDVHWWLIRIFEAELPDTLQASNEEIVLMRTIQEVGASEWDLRKSFEQKLTSISEEDKLVAIHQLSGAWTRFIAFEKSIYESNEGNNKNPDRVNTIYLRACEELGHIRIDLWYSWIAWLSETMKDQIKIAHIYDRAVRYHPHDLNLWIGYLQCQLKKSSQLDVDGVLQVFIRGLKGLSYRQPIEILKFVIITSECIWQSDDTPYAASCHPTPSDVVSSKGSNVKTSDISNGILRIQSGSKVDLITDVFMKTERHFISCLIDEKMKKFYESRGWTNSKLFEVLTTLWDRWCVMEIRYVQRFGEAVRIMRRLLCVFSQRRLEEIVAAANLKKQFTLTTDHHPHQQALDTIDFASDETPKSPWLSEWLNCLNFLIEFLRQHRDDNLIKEIRNIFIVGQKCCKDQPSRFLDIWFSFENEFGSEIYQTKVKELRKECQHDLDMTNPPVTRINLSDLKLSKKTPCKVDLPSSRLSSDSDVVNITLDQLKLKREKRRRHISESETDTFSDTSSDSGKFIMMRETSPSTASPLGVTLLSRKRRRSGSGHTALSASSRNLLTSPDSHAMNISDRMINKSGAAISSDWTSPQLRPGDDQRSKEFEAPRPRSSSPTASSSSSRITTHNALLESIPLRKASLDQILQTTLSPSLPHLHILHESEKEPLSAISDDEVQAIERSTRATWDGHECADPSTTPPIPPVTSCMSPLLRRRSWSGSSTSSNPPPVSPLNISSEVINSNHSFEQQPQRSPHFTSEGIHYSAMDDPGGFWDTPNKGIKRGKEIDTGPKKKRQKPSDKQTEICPPPVPRRGKHFLQSKIFDGDKEPTEAIDNIIDHGEERSTVFVTNLDQSVRESDIKALFSSCSGLKEIRLIRDFMRRNKGYCYIDFEDCASALDAVKATNGAILNERTLRVAVSRPTVEVYEAKTLFVSGLPIHKNVDLDFEIINTIKSASQQHLGYEIEPTAIRLMKEEDGQHKGYGYIDFGKEKEVRDLLRLPVSVWVEKRKEKERKEIQGSIPIPEPQTLFVKNLNFKTNEKKLRKFFKAFGELESVMVCRDSTGKSKGYGFITFVSDKDAFGARVLDGKELDGRELIISQSHRVPTVPKPMEAQKNNLQSRNILSRKDAKKIQLDTPMTVSQLDHNIVNSGSDESETTEGARPKLTNVDFRKFLS